MKKQIVVYWARRDLRLDDNPALTQALAYAKQTHTMMLPLYIVEPYMTKDDPIYQFGYPSRFFLCAALPRFAKQFPQFTIAHGTAVTTLTRIAQTFDITIFVNEDIHPDFYTQVARLQKKKIAVTVCPDKLTINKETKTGAGNVYSIFTPFKKAVWKEFCTASVLPRASVTDVSWFRDKLPVTCVDAHEKTLWALFQKTKKLHVGKRTYDLDTLLSDTPTYTTWYFDEDAAKQRLHDFLHDGIATYKTSRDSLGERGTSQLSLALAWGLLSARTIRKAIQTAYKNDFLESTTNPKHESPVHYISELIWREFYAYLLYHYPTLYQQEFQEKYRNIITWDYTERAYEHFVLWMRGETGYAIVDAAMHQLAQTGYMHNRARMIVASFLTKHLGIDWRWGQEYFRAMLIDLDEPSNNGGWQWGASVGADPKPIRIFNPYLQADKYDAEELYQRTYLPTSYREQPPAPIVEHAHARLEALKRYGLSAHAPTREG